jgi:hypothetical protein
MQFRPGDEEERSHGVEQAHDNDDQPLSAIRRKRIAPPEGEERDRQKGHGHPDHHQPQRPGLVHRKLDGQERRTPYGAQQGYLQEIDEARVPKLAL